MSSTLYAELSSLSGWMVGAVGIPLSVLWPLWFEYSDI